jgi:hypothetical protein
MESKGYPAFCPTCRTEYTFYADEAAAAAPAPRGGRLERPCFKCSFRTSRWDALWIPAILLVVMSFPLLWMIWSNIIGPLVFASPVLLALWRRSKRALGRTPAQRTHGSEIATRAD